MIFSPLWKNTVISVFVLMVPLSNGTQPSSSVAENGELGTSKVDTSSEVFLFMDHLARHYTPNCLRVLMITDQTLGIRKSSKAAKSGRSAVIAYLCKRISLYSNVFMHNARTTDSEIHTHIIINEMTVNRTRKILSYITENVERVSPFSCVTYFLAEPPDSRLLPLLTDSSSSKKLTRYFLVHAQNATDAGHILLDQRLGKEENVAALTHEESQNKTYWRVLIRQLLHPSGSPQFFSVNKWSTDTGLANTENIFPYQMVNFYGIKLRGVAKQYKPFIDFQEVEGSLVVKPKPSVDIFLLDIIAQQLNFTYEIALPVDGQWGYRKDDGVFTGVVGDVQMGRANFSLNLSIMQIRTQAIRFSRMYYAESMTFIVAKSPPSPPWMKLITPFRTSVWVSLVLSVAGGALLYHLIYHVQGSLSSFRLLSSRAVMHILASFLLQPLFHFPWLASGRVFLGSWFPYAFLVTTYYKTSLTSTLAVPILPPSIDTLQQLHQSGVTYGINSEMGATYQLFSSSDILLYQKMFKKMSYHNYADSLRLVAEGRYAYIAFRTPLTLEMVIHNSNPTRKTDLHVAPEESFPGGYAWAFPKNAKYLRTFDAVKYRCVQAGLINKWISDLFSLYVKEAYEKEPRQERQKEEEEALPKKDDGQTILSLHHLQGVFFILFLGIAGGLLLLLMEVFANCHGSTGKL